MVAVVAIGGIVAAFLARNPMLLITSPAVAAALAVVATFGDRTPEWNRAALPVLARLPDGQARVLLADLLRRAAVVPAAAQPGPLVSAACEAARQLAALDVHGDAPVAKRGRALLTQRLQDASAALTRWQAAQGAGESLSALARELSDESRYQQEAAHEVEALLSSWEPGVRSQEAG
ncbi:MAG: hypothetical protein DMD48_01375 [Gemmatimonadetes bacterium]|nr:MAG: hypothetical protein DMD48_01375 [Gemmatimonadota bacterium]